MQNPPPPPTPMQAAEDMAKPTENLPESNAGASEKTARASRRRRFFISLTLKNVLVFLVVFL